MAFPAISTGILVIPRKLQVALQAVLAMVPTLKAVKHIHFVLFSAGSGIYQQMMEELVKKFIGRRAGVDSGVSFLRQAGKLFL